MGKSLPGGENGRCKGPEAQCAQWGGEQQRPPRDGNGAGAGRSQEPCSQDY